MLPSFSLMFENKSDVSIDGSYMPDCKVTYLRNAFIFCIIYVNWMSYLQHNDQRYTDAFHSELLKRKYKFTPAPLLQPFQNALSLRNINTAINQTQP